MPLDSCNENSDLVVTASFFDENDDPVTPDSATYRVDDDSSQTAIVTLTPLSGLSTTKEIRITGLQNVMVNASKAYETRVVTVQWIYATDKRGTAEYRYILKNLAFVTSTLSPV